MNLETQIRQVRARLSDPRRTDPEDSYVTDLELVDFLHQAEWQVVRDLAERESFVQTATFAAVNGQEQYDEAAVGFPIDVMDIVRVTYGGVECRRHPVHELGALDFGSNYRARKGLSQFFYLIGGSLGKLKLGIRPIPDDTSQIAIWYVRRPYRRFRHVRGIVTLLGTNVEIIDSTNLLHVDSYWNTCEVRIMDGLYVGNERVVSAFAAATDKITVSSAFPTPIPVGSRYEVGEVSQMPADLEPLVIGWAAYLGFVKNMAADLGGIARSEYDQMMSRHNQRYGMSRTEPGREPQGAAL